ncbi:hypothetical protein [Oceanicoccus sp. KOV_DT_Chl]|uniref:hypothetical protein n=1 Tax=Oceanicoccus sp. KOV_DT_Chl TaxID=1904639 RepID=UPI000C7A2153|nr:hypothetical protein [Oceanicoccus sp. KOV_DT_Chl]
MRFYQIWLALLIVSFIVFLAFVPGITGAFIFDDFNSIVLNEQLRVDQLSLDGLQQWLMAGDPGILGRPVSMLSFGLNYYLAGDVDPKAFKLGNILVHVVTFIGVFGLSRSLLLVLAVRGLVKHEKVFSLAIIIALMWALNPLQVSSVLYVVQRMAMLAALFSLYALWVYVEWRRSVLSAWLAVPLFLLLSALAFLSKENAILLAGFILLIESWIFSKENGPVYRQIVFSAALVSFIALLCYLHFYAAWFSSGYLQRDFSQYERLLTQLRVLTHYLQWIIIPDISQYGFFHDDILKSTAWLRPQTTLLSAVFWSVLLIVAGIFRAKKPWLAFGVGWFLMGHVLESSFIPLEMVFEHRNYLPSFGVIFCLVLLVSSSLGQSSVSAIQKPLVVIWLVVLAAATLMRSSEWGNYHLQLLAASERHPNSARTQWEMGRWYLTEYQKSVILNRREPAFYEKGLEYAEYAMAADPRSSLALIGLVATRCETGESIDERWVVSLEERLVYPYRVENHQGFKTLVDCALQRTDAKALEPIVGRIFNAVFSNPKISDYLLAELKYVYAEYVYARGDINKAYTLFEQSLALYPLESTYTRLVVHSLELGNKDKAELYLAGYKLIVSDSAESKKQIELLSEYVAICCDKGINFDFKKSEK